MSEESCLETKDLHVLQRLEALPYQLEVGRGLDCDIQVLDKSVSRSHATLVVNSREQAGEAPLLVLTDNYSKYGTYLLVREESIDIEAGGSVAIQVGQNLMHISLKKVEISGSNEGQNAWQSPFREESS